ncbi:MAG: single-stranded-DNA-specific exonuclease RecJ [Paludibacteraceae bacterium]|nr:single-stranded-DNA-specific exonuclease RecJ [Paludibacteraceae bacterium]
MTNQWIFNAPSAEEQTQTLHLAEQMNIDSVLAGLLVQRGIDSSDEARNFFWPKLNHLHDPFLIKDMDKAVMRIEKALANREKMLIYGDYDVDGTTAVALVYKILKKYTSDIGYYIPDRYAEGCGISREGVEYARDNGYKLIIALDCGIKAVEKVALAKSYGIDFIICEHHTTDDRLPDAVAVLDSKREDDTYPYKELSGCGVGFKLMQGFIQRNKLDFSDLKNCLDLVAVSIASDIVPITGENRVLAYHGLRQLNNNPSIGLRSIISVCGLSNHQITMNDIIFKIGPRINASGRLDSGIEVVKLLISNNSSDADKLSKSIDELNEERRSLDEQTTNEATEMLKARADFEKRKSIVVYNSEWSKGIIGIVASRLAEEYYRPTIVLTRTTNGLLNGSARSVQGFDLYTAIDNCRDLLENFGGHLYAAGLSLKEENLEPFIERFEQYVAENITKAQLTPQIEIDAEVEFSQFNSKFLKTLRLFAPFGPGNTNPVFCTRKVKDNGGTKVVGKALDHLKVDLCNSEGTHNMSGIAFHMSDFHESMKDNNMVDVCYTLEENTFLAHHSDNKNSDPNMQLMVKDIRCAE